MEIIHPSSRMFYNPSLGTRRRRSIGKFPMSIDTNRRIPIQGWTNFNNPWMDEGEFFVERSSRDDSQCSCRNCIQKRHFDSSSKRNGNVMIKRNNIIEVPQSFLLGKKDIFGEDNDKIVDAESSSWSNSNVKQAAAEEEEDHSLKRILQGQQTGSKIIYTGNKNYSHHDEMVESDKNEIANGDQLIMNNNALSTDESLNKQTGSNYIQNENGNCIQFCEAGEQLVDKTSEVGEEECNESYNNITLDENRIMTNSNAILEENSSESMQEKGDVTEKLKTIESIRNQVDELAEKIKILTHDIKKKDFLYCEEMLTKCLLKLDNVLADGEEVIRKARKSVVSLINENFQKLELLLSTAIV